MEDRELGPMRSTIVLQCFDTVGERKGGDTVDNVINLGPDFRKTLIISIRKIYDLRKS